MATSSKHPSPGPSGQTSSTNSITIKFFGAAQEEHPSFMELSKTSLVSHCRGWNDPENPRSYMIPPIFAYKNPELPDHEVETIRAKFEAKKKANCDSEDRLVIDRDSDEAERIIFDALYSLTQDQSISPFLVIRGVNLNRIHLDLNTIFPNLKWNGLRQSLEVRFAKHLPSKWTPDTHTLKKEFHTYLIDTLGTMSAGDRIFELDFEDFFDHRASIVLKLGLEQHEIIKDLKKCFDGHFKEYDFVIIGPRVGIVVIEVKGSAFSQAEHYGTERTLPKRLRDGFEQLHSFEAVLPLLSEITGKCVSSSQIRRILVTPNLEKSRFDAWFFRPSLWLRPLDEGKGVSRRERVKQQMDGVQWWFKEDLANDQSVNVDDSLRKPQLYDKLRNHLVDASLSTDYPDIYKLLAPILIGIASVLVKADVKCIGVEEQKLSQPMAVKEESHRVETGDFMSITNQQQGVKKKKASRQQQQWLADRKKVTVWKAMVLSPDQLSVLNGPSHQIIVAPAGCGKTILLEAKALGLLRKGESVLVVCSSSYVKRFEQLFKTHGFHRGLVVPCEGNFGREFIFNSDTPRGIRQGVTRELLESIGLPAAAISEVVDASEERLGHIESISAHNHILIDDAIDDGCVLDATRYCRYVCATASDQQTVWIAVDPILNRTNGTSDFKEHIENLFDIAPSFHHRVVYLTQVMRYPESVYRYVHSIFPITDGRPIDDRDLRPVISHKVPGLWCQKRVANLDQLCKEINQVLTDYRDEFSADQMAIILGGTKRVINGAKRLSSMFTDIVKNVFPEETETVVYGSNVVSLEWPLVIYVEDTTKVNEMFNQMRYVSCTRSTGILFHFICDFNKARSSGASSSI